MTFVLTKNPICLSARTMEFPSQIKPIWRIVQVVQISKGLDAGVNLYIIGPYFYDTFRKVCNDQQALFYATVLWAVFFGLIALLEIPTGALGDTLGRSKVVILSTIMRVLYGLSLVSIFFCHTLPAIFIVGLFSRVINALAYTFFNGNFSAWAVDSIKERDSSFGYERLLGRGHAYYSWSSILGAIIGITAYLHHISYIAFIVGSLVSLGCLTYLMAEMEETRSIPFIDAKRFGKVVYEHAVQTIRTAFKVCNRAPVIWWLLGIFAVYKFLTNIVTYLWPVAMGAQFGAAKWSPGWYILAIGIPLVTALNSRAMAWWGDRAQKKTGKRLPNQALRRWLMASFLVSSIPIIALGILNQKGIISLTFFMLTIIAVEGVFGVVETAFETLVSNYIPHHNAQERATILSLGSVVRGILVFLLIVPSNGGTGMNTPVGWILPGILLLLAVFIAAPRIRAHENNYSSKLKTPMFNEEVT